jgi:glyoxylase-like metal-dependent hydrolase (beta-lactamase superfamily II)
MLVVVGARPPAPQRPTQPNGGQRADFANVEVHVLPVQGNVSMLVGAGGNVTLQIGEDGVLLVDTSVAEMSDKIVAAIRKLTDKPIRYIINTHGHPDHVGGNQNIGRQGSTIAGGNNTGFVSDIGQGAAILAHENTLNRMSAPTGAQSAYPPAAWPTDTFFTRKKDLFFNGEAIEILHQPNAHTDGDVFVFFRRSDVVSAGDIFGTETFPVIDHMRNGSINGIIDALNRLLDITIPKDKQEGGTYVIPGHGRLTDEADVLEYRDMLTIIRDRVQDMVKKGMTLEQVKAGKPTLDYDARYGSTAGFWTTEMFIQAVYDDLRKKS